MKTVSVVPASLGSGTVYACKSTVDGLVTCCLYIASLKLKPSRQFAEFWLDFVMFWITAYPRNLLQGCLAYTRALQWDHA